MIVNIKSKLIAKVVGYWNGDELKLGRESETRIELLFLSLHFVHEPRLLLAIEMTFAVADPDPCSSSLPRRTSPSKISSPGLASSTRLHEKMKKVVRPRPFTAEF